MNQAFLYNIRSKFMTTVFKNASGDMRINVQNALFVKFVEICVLLNFIFEADSHDCLDEIVSELVEN